MINRKIRLALLLCLILLACLVPAAYADGLNDLQEAIGSYNQTGNPNSFTLNEAINAQGTAITIPSGFTLTLNKNLVCGDLAIEPGGSFVIDGGSLKADVSWEKAPVADLVFPAGLTRLESEAFAGGGFRSVFIPAGVTSIAADAFPEGTVLFGGPGSYAETFAGANGFLFAPVG